MSTLNASSIKKLLSTNKYVVTINEDGFILATSFVEDLYEAWLTDPRQETVVQKLSEAGLDLGAQKAGKYFHRLFFHNGNPDQEILIPWRGKWPAVSMLDSTAATGATEALLRTGKFVVRTKGIGLTQEFEEELRGALLLGETLEACIQNAGIPLDVFGKRRLLYLKKKFDGMEKEEEPRYSEETVQQYEGHPFVESACTTRIQLSEAFFDNAASLCDLPIGQVLSVFEISPEVFTEDEQEALRKKLSHWEKKGGTICEPRVCETTVRILKGKAEALTRLMDERWSSLSESIPDLAPAKRKELFTNVAAFVRNRGIPGELNRVLGLLKVPRSTFYGCIANENYGQAKIEKERQDELDAEKVRKVFEYKGFKKGSRIVQMMLPSMCGVKFSLKKVRRLMKKFGMECGVRGPNNAKRRSKEYLETHVKKNLLKRRFRLGRPRKYRLTDVTYLDFGEPGKDGKRKRAYGSAMIDSVSGVLVCMNVSMHNDEDLVMETLRLAKENPWIEGGMIHSDQGVLYLSDEFQQEVQAMGLEQSMSKRGNCHDNSPQESFFGHLKDEVDYESCKTLEELQALLESYSWYYNNERPMACRKGMTPKDYEEYLIAMDDEEFSRYLAGEEEAYLKKKARAKELAIARAKTLGVEESTEDEGHGKQD